jgi:hypothetical protein
MRKLVIRASNIILRPEREWGVIAREHLNWRAVFFGYMVPLATISPFAYGSRVLLAGEGSFRSFADADTALRFALLSAVGGFLVSVLSVPIIALAVRLVVPLYGGGRNFGDAFRVVTYSGTPVWLAGIILIAPLNRFPLLVIVILIALMHGLFLFYLGLHQVTKVPRRDAAECAAIVLVAGIMLSSAVGYYAGAAGLFPHM